MTHIKRFQISRNFDGWSIERASRNLKGMEAALCQQFDDWKAQVNPKTVSPVSARREIENAVGYVTLVVVWEDAL